MTRITSRTCGDMSVDFAPVYLASVEAHHFYPLTVRVFLKIVLTDKIALIFFLFTVMHIWLIKPIRVYKDPSFFFMLSPSQLSMWDRMNFNENILLHIQEVSWHFKTFQNKNTLFPLKRLPSTWQHSISKCLQISRQHTWAGFLAGTPEACDRSRRPGRSGGSKVILIVFPHICHRRLSHLCLGGIIWFPATCFDRWGTKFYFVPLTFDRCQCPTVSISH